MLNSVSTAPRSGGFVRCVHVRASLALIVTAAIVGCDDITQPRSPDGSSWPALELASEQGPRILMGTIPASADFVAHAAYGTEVNDVGQAAVLAFGDRFYLGGSGVSANRAAFWSAATGMVEIPLTYGPGPHCLDDGSIAAGINASGQVVGFGDNCERGQRAFVWSYGEPPVELFTPTDGSSAAFDINTAGVIAGTVGSLDGVRGARWTDPQTLTVLPTLPGYGLHEATGINDDGDVVGFASSEDGSSHTLVLWPGGGGVIALPLPEGWHRYDIARINNRGLVAASAVTPLGGSRAFVWNRLCGGFIDIGPGAAYAVDANGRVVGGGDAGAFVWTAESGQVPLSMLRAYGLSNAGHVVGETLEEGAVMTRVGVVNPNATPLGNAGGSYVASEGSSVVLGDPPAPNPHGYPVCYDWDLGGGITARTPTVTRAFDDDTTFTFTVAVTDAQAQTASATGTVTVNNVAPTAAFAVPATVDEGTDFTLALNDAFDPSSVDVAAGLQFAFDCDRATGYGAFRLRNTRTCAAPNDDVRTVRAKIMDKDGGVTEYTGSVVIRNVAPTVAIDSVQPQTVAKNTAFAVTFSFGDPGIRDRWAYRVDFGHADCPPVVHSLSAVPDLTQGTSYSASCKGYPPAKDPYTVIVAVTVRDNDGGSTTVQLPVTVTK